MNIETKEKLRSRFLISPSALLLISLGMIPLIMLIFFSFTETSMTIDAIKSFTFEYWKSIFTESLFRRLMFKSLKISAIVTLACIIIAYPTAWGIAKVATPEKRSVLLLLTIIPFFTSQLLLMYTIMVMLTGNGIIMGPLAALGLAKSGTSILYSVEAVILILIYEDFSMMILCLYSSLEKIDISVIEASHNLGAGKIRTFLYVVLPQSIPGLLSGVFLVFVPVAGSFAESVRAGGTSGMMIGALINTQFTSVLNMGYGATLSCAFLSIILIIMWVIRLLANRVTKWIGG